MRRRPRFLNNDVPPSTKDPDQDPALWPQVVRGVLAATGQLRMRPLRPGDHRIIGARFFTGHDMYFFKMVRGVNLRPELFPAGLARALQRKAERLSGWQTLRGVLEVTLQRVADSQLREGSELLDLCQLAEDWAQHNRDLAPEAVQHQRFLQVRSALEVRERYRLMQAKLRRDAWLKKRKETDPDATHPRRTSAGRDTPARSFEDIAARELIDELIHRRGR